MSWRWTSDSWVSPSRAAAKRRHFTHLHPQQPSGEKACLALKIRQREEAFENLAVVGARMAERLLPR